MSARADLTLLRVAEARADRMDFHGTEQRHTVLEGRVDLAQLCALAPLARRSVLFSDELVRSVVPMPQAARRAMQARELERSLTFEWEMQTGMDSSRCLTSWLALDEDLLEVVGVERSAWQAWQELHPGLLCAHPESISTPLSAGEEWFRAARTALDEGRVALLSKPAARMPWQLVGIGAAALALSLGLVAWDHQSRTQQLRDGRAQLAQLSAQAEQQRQTERSVRSQLEELGQLRALEAQRVQQGAPRPRVEAGQLVRGLDALARELPEGLQLLALDLHRETLTVRGLALDAARIEQLRGVLLAAWPDARPTRVDQRLEEQLSELPLYRFELGFEAKGLRP